MDPLSIVIIAGIVLLCVLPFMLGIFRSNDTKANDIQGQDPEVARALREASRNIDQGRGFRGRP
ncbi:MAG: hypothetical protein Q4P23_03290 [Micrococcaceae bacterium]|nr:hypothetical protein [Micrococcaceae bacterium]